MSIKANHASKAEVSVTVPELNPNAVNAQNHVEFHTDNRPIWLGLELELNAALPKRVHNSNFGL